MSISDSRESIELIDGGQAPESDIPDIKVSIIIPIYNMQQFFTRVFNTLSTKKSLKAAWRLIFFVKLSKINVARCCNL